MKINFKMPDVISEDLVNSLSKQNNKRYKRIKNIFMLVGFSLALYLFLYPTYILFTSGELIEIENSEYVVKHLFVPLFVACILSMELFLYPRKIIINYGSHVFDVYSDVGLMDKIDSVAHKKLLVEAEQCTTLLKYTDKTSEVFVEVNSAVKLLENIKQDGRIPYVFESELLFDCFEECKEKLRKLKNEKRLEMISLELAGKQLSHL